MVASAEFWSAVRAPRRCPDCEAMTTPAPPGAMTFPNGLTDGPGSYDDDDFTHDLLLRGGDVLQRGDDGGDRFVGDLIGRIETDPVDIASEAVVNGGGHLRR